MLESHSSSATSESTDNEFDGIIEVSFPVAEVGGAQKDLFVPFGVDDMTQVEDTPLSNPSSSNASVSWTKTSKGNMGDDNAWQD